MKRENSNRFIVRRELPSGWYLESPRIWRATSGSRPEESPGPSCAYAISKLSSSFLHRKYQEGAELPRIQRAESGLDLGTVTSRDIATVSWRPFHSSVPTIKEVSNKSRLPPMD